MAVPDLIPRVFAIRHVNPTKALSSLNSENLLKLGVTVSGYTGWHDPIRRVELRDRPVKAPKRPYLVTVNYWKNPWVYVFAVPDSLILDERVVRSPLAEIVHSWVDPQENKTHFRHYKDEELVTKLIAEGCSFDASLRIIEFSSSKVSKNGFKHDKTLGDALGSMFGWKLGLDHVWRPNPLAEREGRLHLQGEPAEFETINLHDVAPLEEGSHPPSDRLLEAIENHDLASVKAAIADGANLEWVSGGRSAPLDLTLFGRDFNPKIPLALIKAGAPFERTRALAELDYLHSEEAELLKVVDFLISQGADPNGQSETGSLALNSAIGSKFVSVVASLLKAGANPHLRENIVFHQGGSHCNGFERAKDLAESDERSKRIQELLNEATSTKTVSRVDPPPVSKTDLSVKRRLRKALLEFMHFEWLERATERAKSHRSDTTMRIHGTLTSPSTIELEPISWSRWSKLHGPGELQGGLEGLGYIHVGEFLVVKKKGLMVQCYCNLDAGIDAMCYRFTSESIELVRHHADGSSVSVSNSMLAETPVRVRGWRRVIRPGATAKMLIRILNDEPIPVGGVRRVEADKTVDRMVSRYQRETRSRKRSARAELRAFDAKSMS